MSHCKHLHSGEGHEPMREPGNRGITGQQPLGDNQSFHYLALKGPKSALKYSIVQRHLRRESDATERCCSMSPGETLNNHEINAVIGCFSISPRIV